MSPTLERIRVAVSAIIGADSPLIDRVVSRLQDELVEVRGVAANRAEKKFIAGLGAAQIVDALAYVASRRTRTKNEVPVEPKVPPTSSEGDGGVL